jgi:hypothetical protein
LDKMSHSCMGRHNLWCLQKVLVSKSSVFLGEIQSYTWSLWASVELLYKILIFFQLFVMNKDKHNWDWQFGCDLDWQSWVILLILTCNEKQEITHLLSISTYVLWWLYI